MAIYDLMFNQNRPESKQSSGPSAEARGTRRAKILLDIAECRIPSGPAQRRRSGMEGAPPGRRRRKPLLGFAPAEASMRLPRKLRKG